MAYEIKLAGVRKVFGTPREPMLVLEVAELTVRPGQFICVVGPSGCGKTTLLRIVGGLDAKYEGICTIDNRTFSGPSADRGYVFQRPALFPWYDVWTNITIGPQTKGRPHAEWEPMARELIATMELEQFVSSYPYQLSGGMAQRVQLARVLMNSPKALLMDEPFGALDYLTRLRMQQLVSNIHASSDLSSIFITHDVDEAIMMADRVVVMSSRPGRIVADIDIEFPRPRSVKVVEEARYGQYKAAILRHLGFSPTDSEGATA
jgi:NitT/TauT family transport system ATP-binding protein